MPENAYFRISTTTRIQLMDRVQFDACPGNVILWDIHGNRRLKSNLTSEYEETTFLRSEVRAVPEEFVVPEGYTPFGVHESEPINLPPMYEAEQAELGPSVTLMLHGARDERGRSRSREWGHRYTSVWLLTIDQLLRLRTRDKVMDMVAGGQLVRIGNIGRTRPRLHQYTPDLPSFTCYGLPSESLIWARLRRKEQFEATHPDQTNLGGDLQDRALSVREQINQDSNFAETETLSPPLVEIVGSLRGQGKIRLLTWDEMERFDDNVILCDLWGTRRLKRNCTRDDAVDLIEARVVPETIPIDYGIYGIHERHLARSATAMLGPVHSSLIGIPPMYNPGTNQISLVLEYESAGMTTVSRIRFLTYFQFNSLQNEEMVYNHNGDCVTVRYIRAHVEINGGEDTHPYTPDLPSFTPWGLIDSSPVWNSLPDGTTIGDNITRLIEVPHSEIRDPNYDLPTEPSIQDQVPDPDERGEQPEETPRAGARDCCAICGTPFETGCRHLIDQRHNQFEAATAAVTGILTSGEERPNHPPLYPTTDTFTTVDLSNEIQLTPSNPGTGFSLPVDPEAGQWRIPGMRLVQLFTPEELRSRKPHRILIQVQNFNREGSRSPALDPWISAGVTASVRSSETAFGGLVDSPLRRLKSALTGAEMRKFTYDFQRSVLERWNGYTPFGVEIQRGNGPEPWLPTYYGAEDSLILKNAYQDESGCNRWRSIRLLKPEELDILDDDWACVSDLGQQINAGDIKSFYQNCPAESYRKYCEDLPFIRFGLKETDTFWSSQRRNLLTLTRRNIPSVSSFLRTSDNSSPRQLEVLTRELGGMTIRQLRYGELLRIQNFHSVGSYVVRRISTGQEEILADAILRVRREFDHPVFDQLVDYGLAEAAPVWERIRLVDDVSHDDSHIIRIQSYSTLVSVGPYVKLRLFTPRELRVVPPTETVKGVLDYRDTMRGSIPRHVPGLGVVTDPKYWDQPSMMYSKDLTAYGLPPDSPRWQEFNGEFIGASGVKIQRLMNTELRDAIGDDDVLISLTGKVTRRAAPNLGGGDKFLNLGWPKGDSRWETLPLTRRLPTGGLIKRLSLNQLRALRTAHPGQRIWDTEGYNTVVSRLFESSNIPLTNHYGLTAYGEIFNPTPRSVSGLREQFQEERLDLAKVALAELLTPITSPQELIGDSDKEKLSASRQLVRLWNLAVSSCVHYGVSASKIEPRKLQADGGLWWIKTTDGYVGLVEFSQLITMASLPIVRLVPSGYFSEIDKMFGDLLTKRELAKCHPEENLVLPYEEC
jgi:hypothetical protein